MFKRPPAGIPWRVSFTKSLPHGWVYSQFYFETAEKRSVKLVIRATFGATSCQYQLTLLTRGTRPIVLTQLPGYVTDLTLEGSALPSHFSMITVSRKQAALRILSHMIRSLGWRPWRAIRPLMRSMRCAVIYGAAGAFAMARSWVQQFVMVRNEYAIWVENYDTLNESDCAAIHSHIERLAYRPRFSIIMPVYNTHPPYLERAIRSVFGQLYPDWELCIADDASTNPRTRKILETYRKNARVRVTTRELNGHIAEASNSAVSMATGDFVVLLDHDDVLSPNALYSLAVRLNQDRNLDLIYSDSDKIDEEDRRSDPHFKPDWNPDLMLAFNVITHLACIRKHLVDRLGGFRKGFEGSQDYDLFLRVTAITTRISHIPQILYHWRCVEGSTALGPQAKYYAHASAQRAIGDYLKSTATAATVESGFQHYHRIVYPLPALLPKVSVIIATRDKVLLLRSIVNGILQKTKYPNLELMIIDNQSQEESTKRFLQELKNDPRVRILSYDYPFNFSAINNWGVSRAEGDIIALLNNDLRIIEKNWLIEMVRLALLDRVGAVGAKLYYPDDTLQHIGVVLGMGGVAGHPLRHQRRDTLRWVGRAHVTQPYSAVTAACLVIQKRRFLEVGGFDDANLAIAFNDVDLCLKLQEKGYHNLFTPGAELYHMESASRSVNETLENSDRFRCENDFMIKKWGHRLESDSYYNPNLSITDEACGPAFPPRVLAPWLISSE